LKKTLQDKPENSTISSLAPTEGKILVSWGSAHKIGMKAGIHISKNA
jgi:hypothetical protein